MASRAQHDRDLAINLMPTLGARRAMHAAEQYGWYGAAVAIQALRKAAISDAPVRTEGRIEHFDEVAMHHALHH